MCARWSATPPTQQRQSLLWHHPLPTSLPAVAEDRTRLWERTPDSPQHLQVRYGLTSQPLALELLPPETAPVEQLDPVAASALHRLLVMHRVQPSLPAALDLRAFSRVEVTGEAAQARALARAMVCSMAAFHSPEDLVVAVLATDGTLPEWEWLKWLPHAQSAEARRRRARAGWSPPPSTTWRRCCPRTSWTGRASAPTSAPPLRTSWCSSTAPRAAGQPPDPATTASTG